MDGNQRPALDVANHFILYSGYTKTQLQIQKMTYIAHGYMLGVHDEPLVSDVVEAWDHGPVFPKVYKAFRGWGSSVIGRATHTPGPFTQKQGDILDNVFAYYGRFCGYYLSDITHGNSSAQTPWQQCYVSGRNSPIDNFKTQVYYKQLHRASGYDYR